MEKIKEIWEMIISKFKDVVPKKTFEEIEKEIVERNKNTKLKKNKKFYKFEIYKDENKEWRFRFIAPNNEIVVSGEGYKRKASAEKAIKLIKNNTHDAIVIEVEK